MYVTFIATHPNDSFKNSYPLHREGIKCRKGGLATSKAALIARM